MSKNIRKLMVMILAGVIVCFAAGCGAAPSETPAADNGAEETVQTDAAEKEEETPPPQPESDSDIAAEPVEEGETTLTFIGHASVKLKAKDGRIVLIDPAYDSPTEYEEEADFVLVTHAHDDHTPNAKVKLKENGVKITWKEGIIDGEYQRWDYDGIIIEAVVAGGNPYHAIGSGVGYLVTVDGICVYHAGDSSNHEALHVLSDRDIDYALYPIDGVYNMDAAEATELAGIIGATHNIPIHMRNASVNEDKSDNFLPEGRLVMKDGTTITLEK